MRVLFAAAALCVAAGVASASSISTLPARNGSLETTPEFGATSFGTWGQTFTLTEDSIVTSFGFEIDQSNADYNPVDFNAYIYQWSYDSGSSGDTGAQMFSTGPVSTSTGEDRSLNFTLVSIDTGELMLSAGTYAILFESLAGGPASWGSVNCRDAAMPSDLCGADMTAYQGGDLIYVDDFLKGDGSRDTDEEDSGRMVDFFVSQNLDSSFYVDVAPISQVPLGASLPLLASGLLGLGAMSARRRKS